MSQRIQELDVFRGAAAMMVVLFHLTTLGNHSSFLFNLGCTGVDLFFIISGFVILMTLEKCKNWKDFVIGRFSRLFPAYWVAVTITSILIFVTSHWDLSQVPYDVSWKKYLVNLTMFQHWFKVRNIDGPYWTLTVELAFYFFMLGLFAIRLLRMIEIIGLPFMALNIISLFCGESFLFHKLINVFPLFPYFPLFYAGIIFYKIRFLGISRLRFFLIILTFVVQFLLFKDFHHNKSAITIAQYGMMLIIYLVLFFLFSYQKLTNLSNRALLFGGSISYSLYLIHQFLSVGVIMPILVNICKLDFTTSAVIAIMICILIAYLINKYVEQPAGIFIKNAYKNVVHNGKF